MVRNCMFILFLLSYCIADIYMSFLPSQPLSSYKARMVSYISLGPQCLEQNLAFIEPSFIEYLLCVILKSHWVRHQNGEIQKRAIIHSRVCLSIHSTLELSNSYSMPATVVGSANSNKNESFFSRAPIQLMGRRENKISEDRQMGRRSLVLQSQGNGENAVLKSMLVSSLQPESYREKVAIGLAVDEDALPKRKRLQGPFMGHVYLCGC